MIYRQLGRAGLRMSCLTLGGGNFGDMTSEETAGRIMQRAIDRGNQRLPSIPPTPTWAARAATIGRFLKATGQRDEVIVVSKLDYPTGPGPNDQGLSRHHVLRACEDSLRRLQTDRIDLYLTHRTAEPGHAASRRRSRP